VTSDNRAVADIRPASLGVLQPAGLTNVATASGIVVVGRQPGTTHLHLHSSQGDRDIPIVVVPAPEHAAPAAVAR
jgi:hypothetical protein